VARAATTIAVVILGLLCLASGASESRADEERARLDDPFEITADQIDYDDERELYTAYGNVRVVQGERRLRARWVAFSTATRLGVAEGDVVVVDGPDELRAQFMVFDVDTLHGSLYQGELDSGSQGFRVQAEELVRTGRNEFEVRKGVFSTCRCEEGERLPWQIRAGEGQVELGGYGTVQNSTFEVLGVPVLWVPWAFFPVKSERETGLLLPDFKYGGRGGFGVGVPFFWAALPELNVIPTQRLFTRRGYKQDVELEYVFGEQSEGDLFVAGLHDRSADSNEPFRNERWAVIWDHDHFLPADWRWQTDFKLPSDNLYPDDFQELDQYSAFRFIESTTNIARDFGRSGSFGAMVASRYANDLQGSTFDDGDEYILQRWAEVRGDVQPGSVVGPLGVEARLDSEVLYFRGLRTAGSELGNSVPPPVLDDGCFFDIGVNGRVDGQALGGEANGVFDAGEPICDRGTRVLLHPRLSRSFQLGGIAEFAPEIGWHQTLYRSKSQKFAERGLFTAHAELRSRVARDYLDASGGGVRHIVEPRLGWAVVTQRGQKDNPLFIAPGSVEQSRLRVLSLQNVTRDPADRIDDTNEMVFAVNQRFFSRSRALGDTRLLADVATAVDWKVTNNEGLGNLTLDARLFPTHRVGARVRGSFNPESVAWREGGVGLGVALPIENDFINHADLSTSYRYLRRLPLFAEFERDNPNNQSRGDTQLNHLDVTVRVQLWSPLRLSYSALYSFVEDDGALRHEGGVEWVSRCRCIGLGVFVRDEKRQGYSGGFNIRFLGLGDDQSDLFSGGLGAGVGF
jgi:lipopolysaccharide assembly outer membrane protein LptD (OstA)